LVLLALVAVAPLAAADPSTAPATSSATTAAADLRPIYWGEVSANGMQLGVQVASTKMFRGYPVDIILTLRNVSEKSVWVRSSSSYQNYRYDVRHLWGEQLPFTEFGKRLYDDYLRLTFDEVPAGEQIVTVVRLSTICDLSMGGQHLVRVIRPGIGQGPGRPETQVVSGVLPIELRSPGPLEYLGERMEKIPKPGP
jgi:hypothetical protein